MGKLYLISYFNNLDGPVFRAALTQRQLQEQRKEYDSSEHNHSYYVQEFRYQNYESLQAILNKVFNHIQQNAE